jgi:hypothetical protein
MQMGGSGMMMPSAETGVVVNSSVTITPVNANAMRVRVDSVFIGAPPTTDLDALIKRRRSEV